MYICQILLTKVMHNAKNTLLKPKMKLKCTMYCFALLCNGSYGRKPLFSN